MLVLIYDVPGSRDQKSLVLDVSVSEQHASENEITEHPVEVGANVVDHSRVKPITFSADVMLCDSSLEPESPYNQNKYQEGRANEVLATLFSLKDQAILCSVDTGVKTYDSMLVESISETRTSQTISKLGTHGTKAPVVTRTVSITFREVRVVSTQIVKAIRVDAAKQPGAQTQIQGGKKETTKSKVDGRTLLKRWLE